MIINLKESDWKDKTKIEFEALGFSVKVFKNGIKVSYLYKTIGIWHYPEGIYIKAIPERFYEKDFKNLSLKFEEKLLKEWIEVQNEKRNATEKKKNVIKFSTELFGMSLQADFDRLGIVKTLYHDQLSNYKYIKCKCQIGKLNCDLYYSTNLPYKKLDNLDLYRCKWEINFTFTRITRERIDKNLKNILETFSKEDLRNLLEKH